MRIAHVVTYVSQDGAFGGPARVALAQAKALAQKGHDVTVYAAAPRAEATDSRRDGYRLRKFPARKISRRGGFATMVAPDLTRALRRAASEIDVAHVHLARDLVTLPAAAVLKSKKVPFLVQTHGMVDPSTRLLSRPLDVLATRPLLRSAEAVLVLTDQEARDIAAVASGVRPTLISNGIEIGDPVPYEGRDNFILFLARLHPRKRPLAFIEMAVALRDVLPDMRFVLAGPDEGEGAAVVQAIEHAAMGARLSWIGAVSPDDTDGLLTAARAMVLPSIGEVFPMTILESFRLGTPVITTNSLGIADECLHFGAAQITDGSPQALANAVEIVVRDETTAEALRMGSRTYLKSRLDITAVASKLELLYEAGRAG